MILAVAIDEAAKNHFYWIKNSKAYKMALAYLCDNILKGKHQLDLPYSRLKKNLP
jgi:hypothetical protein